MRVRATAMFLKPPAHSGTVVWSGVFSGGMKPPPKCATSVNVCGSPPWSTTFTVVPSLIVSASGSKSQPGSGLLAWALENRSFSTVNAPSVTFLQKSGPSAALNVVGSHSSNATTCTEAGGGASSSCAAPANTRPAATRPTLIKVNLDINPPLCFSNSTGLGDGPPPMPCMVREASRTGNGERLKFCLNSHALRIRGEIRHLRQRRGYNPGRLLLVESRMTPNLLKLADDLELDRGAYELRRAGKALRLPRTPWEPLLLLVGPRGALVTRDEIAARLWGKDVFLDTDNS